jgi:hypothetical protein
MAVSQRAQLRLQRDVLEDVAEAVVQAIGDEQADGDESDQLDPGLERDGGHHALVAFGRVEVPGAEDDRERGQDQRDVEADVGRHRHRRAAIRHDDFRVAQQQADGARNGLELQRNVGNDADHGDDRHQPAEQMALAIARGNEIGDRGDAVGLDDADHLEQHEPAERHHQRRPEVDRQEADSRHRGAPDAAVEGPGGAIDGHRERVDGRVGNQRPPLVGALVAPPGDGKQQPEIEQRNGDQDRCVEHRLPETAFDGPGHDGDDDAPGEKDIGEDQRHPEHLGRPIEDRKKRIIEQQTTQQESRDQSVSSQYPAMHVSLP